MKTACCLVFAFFAAVPPSWGDSRLASVRERLVVDGFEAGWIDSIYDRPGVDFDLKGASLYFKHREAQLNYSQFLSAESIQKAQGYMEAHATGLARAEKTYGVDREIITAILLVETRLGTYVGKSSILNVLSSLSALAAPDVRTEAWNQMPEKSGVNRAQFDQWCQQKSRWAYKELKAFLTYMAKEDLDPTEITGSYAGAMGIAQFMPTSILEFAKDGNRDGQVNLFHHDDAIASVGNYLKRNGWRHGMSQREASKVLYRYNRSEYYVNTILKIAELLKEKPDPE